MQGYLSLILHAHLPFVRHPEHDRFLEETWLFEAMTETYIPLLQMLDGWANDGMFAPITITLTPTLCTMLSDSLLMTRYRRHLEKLIELADKETHRTLFEKPLHDLASFYLERFRWVRAKYDAWQGDLLAVFRRLHQERRVELITSAATHALLPLLANHPPSLRAQILVARDHFTRCFGSQPEGIWLPECAYVPAIEPVLREANIRWFVLDTHGILNANPKPRYGMFSPIISPGGVAVFGRDLDSASQVWSRDEGYPGDPRYRDFYRDIGFDLELEYLKPFQAATGQRGFSGIKYHRITGPGTTKAPYDRPSAVKAADDHASHFLQARMAQFRGLSSILDRPPIVTCPYDAELFGHWWYEGIEFLNFFVRKAYFDQNVFELITPAQFLRKFPTHQVASPAASSWGESGYWRVWLNEQNQWVYPHLRIAQERMSELAKRYARPKSHDGSASLESRAMRQAGRELLLAQASDWPFILRTGTSPDYAKKRVTDHVLRFTRIYEQLQSGQIDLAWLEQVEAQDNVFPELDCGYFG
ncbi:MAG TPA: 1,4-alpha-glucan branching protein domain-containing protein [Verrucomicrobiae bacterium]|nr:1,4-alpha-glucan branching protein domain-containing protein [Verrucomicrobiae bacterium]